MGYSVYLAEQLARSGLDGHVVLLEPVRDLEPAYALADVFYLSSRLDPMPNVTIEAAMHGLPVVCFEGASGIAEVLKRDATTAQTVVPHLDTHAAARCIVELAKDKELRERIGAATRSVAEATFDMDRYIGEIDEIGGLAAQSMRQRRADFETIAEDPLFDARIALPANADTVARDAAISRFLAHWSAARTAPRQLAHLDLRRPCAGFNPQIYALHHPEIFDQDINPFADFIRNGRPEGPWMHRVIRAEEADRDPPAMELRTAIQAHFHYPELIEEFLAKLSVNETRCDLLLSTNDEAKAELLRAATAAYQRGRAEVRIFPNQGRDIAPLLTGFGEDIAQRLRRDRPPALKAQSRRGRRDGRDLARVPLAASSRRPARDDGHCSCKPCRRPQARAHLPRGTASVRLGRQSRRGRGYRLAEPALPTPLPQFFEFPVGTMFWARTAALAPLFELELGWDDYPAEPLANDGTMLHALERLLPFAAEKAGFTYMRRCTFRG